MKVRNIGSWSFRDGRSIAHNEVIELDDKTARDRIAAGLAEPVEKTETATSKKRKKAERAVSKRERG